jgi:hypothetical protein
MYPLPDAYRCRKRELPGRHLWFHLQYRSPPLWQHLPDGRRCQCLRIDLREVPAGSQRHADLSGRLLHGPLQLGLPQLRRCLREQQRPGDLWTHGMLHGLQGTHRRNRELQWHCLRPRVPRQPAAKLQWRVPRPERGLQRHLPDRSEVLRQRRDMRGLRRVLRR